MAARNFILRHVASGRFYSHSHLGGDVMTDSRDAARGWATQAAAAKFAARFGTRYEVAPAVPVHRLPSSCHVCGAAAAVDTGRPPCEHDWTNAESSAWAEAYDARTTVRYSDGTTNPDAHYVASVRPY